MRYLGVLSGLLATLPCAGVAHSQAVQSEARAVTGGVSASLRVQTTAPILRACGPYPRGGSCFRISFMITPKVPGEFKVGYFSGGSSPWIYETHAYAATGAACKAFSIGGLAYGGVPGFNAHPEYFAWFDEPSPVTAEKPAVFITEFACDDRLVEGDTITLQLSLAVDGGRRVEFVRYAVPEMQLRAAR